MLDFIRLAYILIIQVNQIKPKTTYLTIIMLTSKQLIDKTGISRATLNNYIARGLLPRPLVKSPGMEGEGARQIGYFPDETVDLIHSIQTLKRGGLSMDQIAARLQTDGAPSSVTTQTAAVIPHPAAAPAGEALALTMDQIPYPAYMVNASFEVTWFNESAQCGLSDMFTHAAENRGTQRVSSVAQQRQDDCQLRIPA
jgi:DNA-binding transcriptional MerR regulator